MTIAQWVCSEAENNATVAIVKLMGLISCLASVQIESNAEAYIEYFTVTQTQT